MSALKNLIEEANAWRRITEQPEYVYPPTTRKEVLHWCRVINAKFEPEVLTCDGELPRHAINDRINQLNKAYTELYDLDRWGAVEEAEKVYL